MSRREYLRRGLFEKRDREDEDQSTASLSSNSRDASVERRDQTLEPPSKRQRVREAAIHLLDIGAIISDATDLLKPMKAICGVLKKGLEVAKSIEKVDEDWKILIKRLKLHIDTIESQTNSLEEDESIDGNLLPLNPIEKPLRDYMSKLNDVCKQLNIIYEQWHKRKSDGLSRMKRALDVDHNKGIILQITHDLDDAFQRYTIALQDFVANKVDQTHLELAQFRMEFKHEVNVSHLERLKKSSVYGHQHRQCHTGTRVKTLEVIRQWANNESTADRIFCLLDAAGMGKSTVAKHMVEEWKQNGWLVGRFFFSRDTTETMSTRLFCSTISDAFAGRNAPFKAQVAEFKEQVDWQHLSLEEQFEGLVAGPLRTLNQRAILTIDALDECEDRRNLLETLCGKQSSIPLLRTFVTGRPEVDIKRWAGQVTDIRITNFYQLEGSNRDVERYIRYMLRDMPEVQDRVMCRAEGLFIYARIACDFLVEAVDVESLLKEMEEDLSEESRLDSIYRVALKQAAPRDQPSQRAMITVLQMILAAEKPLSIAELEILSPWVGKDIVERIVDRLGSLLIYQSREDPIRLLHITIREFLTAPQRPGIYYIQLGLGHYTLALGSINFLKHQSTQITGEWDRIIGRKVVPWAQTLVDLVF